MTEPTVTAPRGTGADPDDLVSPGGETRRAALWSVAGHLLILALVVVLTRGTTPLTLPPAYSVELVAAPAGARALGAVEAGDAVPEAPSVDATAPDEPDTEPAPAPKPAVRKPPVRTPPTPVKPVLPPKPAATTRGGGAATTVPGATRAGGGPTGGRGSDVASVRVQGIAFPFPGYLQNITRQIALNFKAQPGVALRAQVSFLIHRDGSVSELRLLSRSGLYAFDLECLGAVEAVGQRKSFGPLPSGFQDDVLPVVFSFDPSVLR